MFLRLKDNQGVVSLVNLSQAKYIQPSQTESGEPAVKIVWAHDTFTDHGEDDLPDEACTYSEQLYVDVTVGQIEGFLRSIGAAFIPKATDNGQPTGKEPASTNITEEQAAKTSMEILKDGIETIKEAKSKPIPENTEEQEPPTKKRGRPAKKKD